MKSRSLWNRKRNEARLTFNRTTVVRSLFDSSAPRRRWSQSPAGARTNIQRPLSPPHVRAKKVERAKELIADTSYPPRSVLQSVAQLLLRHTKFWLFLIFLGL